MLVFVLGIVAAVFLGAGFVFQQRAASDAPLQDSLRPKLLIDLVRQPIWLIGIGFMIVGQLVGAAALGFGSLVTVEPLLAANLVFALLIAAAWHQERLGRREWLGAVMCCAGLGGFVWAASPSGTDATGIDWSDWVIALGVGLGLAALLTYVGHSRELAFEATLYGAAAGVLYGIQDALTRRTLFTGEHGGIGVVFQWSPWVLLAVAIAGLVVAQSAFQAAPLPASLPAITIAEPITGIAFGAGVYGNALRLGPGFLAAEIGFLLLMCAGLFLLSRSPIVTRHDALRHECEPSTASSPAGSG